MRYNFFGAVNGFIVKQKYKTNKKLIIETKINRRTNLCQNYTTVVK